MLLRCALTVTMPAAVVWLLFAAPLGYLLAQDFPYKGKTVRVIVGFPSGGSPRVRQSDNQEASSTMIKIIHG
jgi:hypothetical protein